MQIYRVFHRFAEYLATTLALLGGGVLFGLIVLTCGSILGRALLPLDLGFGPIRGIYDMTEIGIAVAIFAFLPWAQLRETHARVDLFRWVIPNRINHALDIVFNAMMAVVVAVGSYRLYLGMVDKIAYGETTLIAQIPVWYGYAASLIGAVGFFLIALFCTLRAVRRLMGGGAPDE